MDFKEASDALFTRVTHDDLAEQLGVSVALVRQARLKDAAVAHRAPPKSWKRAMATLAEQQIERYKSLLLDLKEDNKNIALGDRLQKAKTIANYFD